MKKFIVAIVLITSYYYSPVLANGKIHIGIHSGMQQNKGPEQCSVSVVKDCVLLFDDGNTMPIWVHVKKDGDGGESIGVVTPHNNELIFLGFGKIQQTCIWNERIAKEYPYCVIFKGENDHESAVCLIKNLNVQIVNAVIRQNKR